MTCILWTFGRRDRTAPEQVTKSHVLKMLVFVGLSEVCKGLKEMRDNKLYKELNYQNFEEYCEKEVGITYRQAKKYVAIASGFSADEGSRLPSIGTEKLYLLAKLDEPQREEIQQKVDIDSVSVTESSRFR